LYVVFIGLKNARTKPYTLKTSVTLRESSVIGHVAGEVHFKWS